MARRLVMSLKTPTKVTIASGGTAQPLSATDLFVANLVVLWNPGNSGSVYVGESDVTSSKCLPLSATTPSLALSADEKLGDTTSKVFNLKSIFIDGTTADSVFLSYVEVTESNS